MTSTGGQGSGPNKPNGGEYSQADHARLHLPRNGASGNSHGDSGLPDSARLPIFGVVTSYPAQTVLATTQSELVTSWRASVDEQGASEADIGNVWMMAIWPTLGFARLFELTYRDLAAPVST